MGRTFEPWLDLTCSRVLHQLSKFVQYAIDHFRTLGRARTLQGELNRFNQVGNRMIGNKKLHGYLSRNFPLAILLASSNVCTRPAAMSASDRSTPWSSMER